MKADTKAEREFMEQKKNKLLSDMIQMIQIKKWCTGRSGNGS